MQLDDTLRNALVDQLVAQIDAGSTIPRAKFQIRDSGDVLLWECELYNGGSIAAAASGGSASLNPPYSVGAAANYAAWTDLNAPADANKIDCVATGTASYAQIIRKGVGSPAYPKLKLNTQAELDANPTWTADVIISNKSLAPGYYPTFPSTPTIAAPVGSSLNS